MAVGISFESELGGVIILIYGLHFGEDLGKYLPVTRWAVSS